MQERLAALTDGGEAALERGREFRLTVGPAIPPQALEGEAADVAAALKAYVERRLPADPSQAFA